MNTKNHSNFNEMEDLVRENNDPVLIANEEEFGYGTGEQYHAYVDNTLLFYLQEMVIQDIRSANLPEEEEMELIDRVGNICAELYDDKLYSFYRNRYQFQYFLEDLRP